MNIIRSFQRITNPAGWRHLVLVSIVCTAGLLLTACQSSAEQGNPTRNTPEQKTSVKGEEPEVNEDQMSTASDHSYSSRLQPEQIPSLLLEGKYEQVYQQLSDEFRQQITLEQLAETSRSSLQHIRSFKTLGHSNLNDYQEYLWLSDTGKLGMTAVLDSNDTIVGLQLQTVENFPKTDQTLTQTTYRLPLKGDWFVYWGGTNVLQNYHYAVESQRYAYDFVQAEHDKSYTGDPQKNESYYAFGQPALAPADGKVVSVINDIADNEPVGKMNPEQPGGNMVVIDHGGEYSMLAHLKKGTVTVKTGDMVKAGEQVGEIGNSGNSSEAHLHFQVSDGPEILEDRSIRIRWEKEMDPVKGEVVQAVE